MIKIEKIEKLAVLLMGVVALSGCDKRDPLETRAPTIFATTTQAPPRNVSKKVGVTRQIDELEMRLAAIESAVVRWSRSTNLRAAHSAAEEARNLVVGPSGPNYGDSDRDGNIAGSSDIGLLPGLDGQAGLARMTDGPCIVRDVLGGGWEDPSGRWSNMETVIKAWTSSKNTLPTLRSHPQRIVGWATLTLATDQLVTARNYGGHAKIHSDVSKAALKACDG